MHDTTKNTNRVLNFVYTRTPLLYTDNMMRRSMVLNITHKFGLLLFLRRKEGEAKQQANKLAFLQYIAFHYCTYHHTTLLW